MKSRRLAMNAGRKRGGTAQIASLPAPVAGWNTAESLANSPPATARVLDNWRPTETGIVLRGGTRTIATISLAGAPVESLITYNGSTLQKMFAASASSIFDVTDLPDPGVPPTAAVSSRTSGYYSFVNFTTSGGAFLTAVNGTDPLLLYEPSTGWKPITDTSTPSITGVSTSLLTAVWVYRNRQFFVEKNSLRARYLPTGAIAGALGTIDMNGVFQRGGSLLFGATWSVDAGDGLDDKCVFVTTEGEVAIFEGSNPASSAAADWSLVGRYDIAKPLGPRATMRAGGDLVIATQDGMVPLSAAVNKDVAALTAAAISRAIAPDWQAEAARRQGLPWEVLKWPAKGYAMVSLPVTLSDQEPVAFVVNTNTGAWCRYTNWPARCMGLFRGRLFIGTPDGRVKAAELGGTDDGAGIFYTVVGNPEHLGARGAVKTVKQARATFIGSTPIQEILSASMDYVVSLPSPPNASVDAEGSEWDVGKWDIAKWDAPARPSVIAARWVSIGRTGYVMQYTLQITGGLAATPDTQLVSIDVSFDVGSVIV